MKPKETSSFQTAQVFFLDEYKVWVFWIVAELVIR